MPEQEHQDPPPWADLPPVGPARPRHGGRVGAEYPVGSRPTEDSVPSDGPRQDGGGQGPPPWAGPYADEEQVPPAAPSQGGPRAPGGRALRAAARRRRRWLVMLAGLVVAAGTAIAVVLLTEGGPGPASVVPGALITTFQRGELQQVPNACGTVPSATVQQYLPGRAKAAAPLPVDGAAQSACDWTIDQPPVYRLLQLNLLAYAPNGLASGNGSATFAAIDAYDSALAGMQDPPKNSAEPPATVTTLPGLGNEAFSALQVFRRGGAVTDVATVVIRYHNVVVTATMNGLQHSNRGNYGPVSASQLSAAALAFAQSAEATLH